tara:strand:- start:339 stop:647 length:309 start_codon:yes stop_codon:yes gene_type:complete
MKVINLELEKARKEIVSLKNAILGYQDEINVLREKQTHKANYNSSMTREQYKAIRTKLQYSQDEFANLLGIDKMSVSRHERGERAISNTLSILIDRIYQDEK